MQANRQAVLYHVHDPMCSWCWGFRRSWDSLRTALPESVRVINVVGGLAPDSDQPMPAEQRKIIAGYWQDVHRETGAQFNFEFWEKCTPRRSTYPACRAVLAAARQSAEQAMIDAIQNAYYLRAMNPSDAAVLVALATELDLDKEQFEHDLASPGVQRALESDFSLRRQLGVRGFPSLVLAQGEQLTPVGIDYRSCQPALDAITLALRS